MSEISSPPSKALDEKYCGECATPIKSRAEICPHCGVRQSLPHSSALYTAENGKSRIAAALFAFFLGGIGVHKFYLGQVGQGLLYLIFFWTLIPAFVAFIEFIILLCMSDETFNKRFGRN